MKNKNKVILTHEQLELIADICHNYKDIYRGCPSLIKPVMELEANLVQQTCGEYEPDPTYDL